MCWAASTNYLFQLGSLQIAGPFVRSASCTLTEACALQLAGVGLASTNAVRILESGSACGSAAAGVSTFLGLAATTSATPTHPFGVYALSTEVTSSESQLPARCRKGNVSIHWPTIFNMTLLRFLKNQINSHTLRSLKQCRYFAVRFPFLITLNTSTKVAWPEE